VDRIFACTSLSDGKKAAMLGNTAAKLLKLGA